MASTQGLEPLSNILRRVMAALGKRAQPTAAAMRPHPDKEPVSVAAPTRDAPQSAVPEGGPRCSAS